MLKKFPHLIKSSLKNLMPYIPGKDADLLAKDLQLEKVIKLASNENPLGPSPMALTKAKEALTKSHYYPDSNGTVLRERLAEKFSLPFENLILGSGSDSLIHGIAQTFICPGDEVIMSEYAFASYEIATLANEGIPVVVSANNYSHDLSAMLQKISNRTKLIYLANPNNPTGTWFTHLELEIFLQQVPQGIIVILDEAYYEFMQSLENYPNSLTLQKNYDNLIITRSFSKAYGLAGFRMGYAFADASIIELLNRIRSPFTFTVPSLAAAEGALDDRDFLQNAIECNEKVRKTFLKELNRLNLTNIAEVGNFVTVDFGNKCHEVFQYLLQQGIILRPLTNYKLDNFLRITIGLEADMQLLINKLEKFPGFTS